jgi:hypothetical protein
MRAGRPHRELPAVKLTYEVIRRSMIFHSGRACFYVIWMKTVNRMVQLCLFLHINYSDQTSVPAILPL